MMMISTRKEECGKTGERETKRWWNRDGVKRERGSRKDKKQERWEKER
jgi:hypothetical protein